VRDGIKNKPSPGEKKKEGAKEKGEGIGKGREW